MMGMNTVLVVEADLVISNVKNIGQKGNQLIGQLVEIRADAKTKSKDAVAFSLRFPRFKCFRGFKAGEKV